MTWRGRGSRLSSRRRLAAEVRVVRAVVVTGIMAGMLPFLAVAFAIACAVAMTRAIIDDA